MSFVFYIKPSEEKGAKENLAHLFATPELASLDLAEKDVSIASLEFAMKIVGDPGLEDLGFDEYLVQFRTTKNRQLLVIDTRRMNEGVEPGRFKIRRVWSDAAGKGYSQDAHIQLEDMSVRTPGFDGAIHEDVWQVILDFNMPGNKKTEPFRFYLTVEDTLAEIGKKNTEECDPQVGNDPP